MSQRDRIRMDEGEIRDFLRGRKTIIVCSQGPGGFPHPMPMWFTLDDDGTIRMTTFRKSQKVKNIRRDPRVSVLAEDGADYFELRGAVLYGKAEIVDELEVVEAALVRGSRDEAGADPKARAGMEAVVAATARKRVCILIRPERVVSWDHRKLAGKY